MFTSCTRSSLLKHDQRGLFPRTRLLGHRYSTSCFRIRRRRLVEARQAHPVSHTVLDHVKLTLDDPDPNRSRACRALEVQGRFVSHDRRRTRGDHELRAVAGLHRRVFENFENPRHHRGDGKSLMAAASGHVSSIRDEHVPFGSSRVRCCSRPSS